MKHCCKEMTNFSADPRVSLEYEPVLREYSIIASESGNVIQEIYFCPWCGEKLPPSLRKEWYEEIVGRLGLDPDEDEDKIPAEFKSEEWWKKRKL